MKNGKEYNYEIEEQTVLEKIIIVYEETGKR